MNLGDSFVNVNPGSLNHLWVVITNIDANGQIAIVNFTTRQPSSDASCVIAAGEHPYVKHDTVVMYRLGQIVDDGVLERAKRGNYLRMQPPLSQPLLARVQSGALRSQFTPQAIQVAIRVTLGVSD